MNTRALLLTVAVTAAATVASTGASPAVQDAGSAGAVGAVAAADALASGERGTSYFSDELVDELGYRPGVVDGHATNPDGDCSSPVPLPASFEPACRTHDLGYDLLRVADRTGETIPPHTRRNLDRQLASQMTASCEDGNVICRAAATVAHVAVAANTLRQHNGAPVEEWFPWSHG